MYSSRRTAYQPTNAKPLLMMYINATRVQPQSISVNVNGPAIFTSHQIQA